MLTVLLVTALAVLPAARAGCHVCDVNKDQWKAHGRNAMEACHADTDKAAKLEACPACPVFVNGTPEQRAFEASGISSSGIKQQRHFTSADSECVGNRYGTIWDPCTVGICFTECPTDWYDYINCMRDNVEICEASDDGIDDEWVQKMDTAMKCDDPPARSWWIVGVVTVVLLAVGSVAAFFLTKGNAPNLSGGGGGEVTFFSVSWSRTVVAIVTGGTHAVIFLVGTLAFMQMRAVFAVIAAYIAANIYQLPVEDQRLPDDSPLGARDFGVYFIIQLIVALALVAPAMGCLASGKVSNVACCETQCCGVILLWTAMVFLVLQYIGVIYDTWLSGGAIFKSATQQICIISSDNSACDALFNANILYGACACFYPKITEHVTISNM
jgi:hypothetical protein